VHPEERKESAKNTLIEERSGNVRMEWKKNGHIKETKKEKKMPEWELFST